MRKPIFLLTVSAVMGLMWASLPTGATAGEYVADCEVGPSCSASISGGAVELSNSASERISCAAVSGESAQTSGTSTGNISLTFTGCKETATIFHFKCNSPKAEAGKITVPKMVTHLVNLEDSGVPKLPGILITGVNVTFECAGFAKTTITGNILGRYVLPECGVFSFSNTITFTNLADGVQTQRQVTTSGTIFDMISNNDAGGTYFTEAMRTTITASPIGSSSKITC